jgi:hypothetical protein
MVAVHANPASNQFQCFPAGLYKFSEQVGLGRRGFAHAEDVQAITCACDSGRAHQLWDQGNLKFAIVEGVTAVEVAISERLREKGKPLEKSLKIFGDCRSMLNYPRWQ